MRNLIERAVLLGSGTLMTLIQLGLDENAPCPGPVAETSDNNALPKLTPTGIDISEVLQSIEKSYFEQALTISNGNASKAAKLLKLSRDKFRYRRQKI